MNNKLNEDDFLKSIQLIKEIKEHNEQHRKFNSANYEVPSSFVLNIKSILIASAIIGLALFILVGSIVLTPLVLIVVSGYVIFLCCKRLVK